MLVLLAGINKIFAGFMPKRKLEKWATESLFFLTNRTQRLMVKVNLKAATLKTSFFKTLHSSHFSLTVISNIGK